jgi:hypothetical protein
MANNDVTITIYVNTVPTPVPYEKISFEKLVKIAFGDGADPSAGYRITYERGGGHSEPKDLPEHGSVMVQEDMIFNVSPTGLS